jgi:hypothetical protein
MVFAIILRRHQIERRRGGRRRRIIGLTVGDKRRPKYEKCSFPLGTIVSHVTLWPLPPLAASAMARNKVPFLSTVALLQLWIDRLVAAATAVAVACGAQSPPSLPPARVAFVPFTTHTASSVSPAQKCPVLTINPTERGHQYGLKARLLVNLRVLHLLPCSLATAGLCRLKIERNRVSKNTLNKHFLPALP